MSTSTNALKKGTPPPRDASADIIKTDPRGKEQPKGLTKPLQFRVSQDFFEEFSAEAAERFGFTHGAKTQLFRAMWEAYKTMKA